VPCRCKNFETFENISKASPVTTCYDEIVVPLLWTRELWAIVTDKVCQCVPWWNYRHSLARTIRIPRTAAHTVTTYEFFPHWHAMRRCGNKSHASVMIAVGYSDHYTGMCRPMLLPVPSFFGRCPNQGRLGTLSVVRRLRLLASTTDGGRVITALAVNWLFLRKFTGTRAATRKGAGHRSTEPRAAPLRML